MKEALKEKEESSSGEEESSSGEEESSSGEEESEEDEEEEEEEAKTEEARKEDSKGEDAQEESPQEEDANEKGPQEVVPKEEPMEELPITQVVPKQSRAGRGKRKSMASAAGTENGSSPGYHQLTLLARLSSTLLRHPCYTSVGSPVTYEAYGNAALEQDAPGSETQKSKKPVYFEWAKKIWESEETFKLPDGTHWPYVRKPIAPIRPLSCVILSQ